MKYYAINVLWMYTYVSLSTRAFHVYVDQVLMLHLVYAPAYGCCESALSGLLRHLRKSAVDRQQAVRFAVSEVT